MHLHRVITGLVALPFLVYLIYKGGIYFSVLIAAVCVLSLWEYFRIVFNSQDKSSSHILLIIISLCFGLALVFAAYKRSSSSMLIGTLYSYIIVCGFFSLTQFKYDSLILQKISTHIQGMVYISLSLALLVMIRQSPYGATWIFWIIGIIFAGDIGAYYVGRAFGKHKLCPSVSPGKTIEGAVGGLAANMLLGSAVKFFFFPNLPWRESLLMFVCMGIAGQIGDLVESEFKRAAGVKDSGTILPGHGGILDRIDALLFAAPVAFLFKRFVLTVG